jgi:hypothetical protein
MALYKLTKGTLSRIRKSEKECKDLMKDGYVLDGEVDKNYKVTNKDPFKKK